MGTDVVCNEVLRSFVVALLVGAFSPCLGRTWVRFMCAFGGALAVSFAPTLWSHL
ncbi:hypothetical protein AB3X91_08955 [Paraburkholderia sp. BR14263]|uniref:hypothetical protein n=1 Tax=unclassified Paraburkholderia TaxID=2615204 RepID=UPI0034CD981D